VGRESFSLPTPTAFGLCISPSGVSMVVFGCLYLVLCVMFVLIVALLGRFLVMKMALCLFKKKKAGAVSSAE